MPASTTPAGAITGGDVASGFTNTNSTDQISLLQDDEYTFGIGLQTITESEGVTVTQNGKTGLLKVGLSGEGTTVVISCASGVVFDTSFDLVIGAPGNTETVSAADISSATPVIGGNNGKAIITKSGSAVTAITMILGGSGYNNTNDIRIAGTVVNGGSLTIPAAALTPFRLALINGSFAGATGVTVSVPW